MRRIGFLAVSASVSALFLWLALRDVPVSDVVNSIKQADLRWVAASLFFTTIGLWARAVRWRGLLGFKIPLTRAFHIVNITFLLNQLPLRAGEVARSLLASRSGVPVVTAAASIVVERLLDTFLVVVMLALALGRLPEAPDVATRGAALFGIGAAVGFMILLFFTRRPRVTHDLLTFIEHRVPIARRLPLRRVLENAIDGLQPLTRWRSFAHAIGWTLISWTFSFATLYALERALAISAVDLVISAILGVALASFSIAIPVSVAAIGPFEGAIRVAGEAVNMTPVLATSLGFLLHGMTVLGYAIWGSVGLLSQGVSLADAIGGKEVMSDEENSIE